MIRRIGLLAALFLGMNSYAELCPSWTTVKSIGKIPAKFVDESSGLEVSTQFGKRLYHINDSGSGPEFFMTDASGASVKKIGVQGARFFDTEDLTYGGCGNTSELCLYIADIGDNAEIRRSIRFHAIKELENFPSSVRPLKTVEVKYPDRAHNAEAVAIHPTGDIFLVTKEKGPSKNQVATVHIFRLRSHQFWSTGRGTRQFEKIGTWDLDKIHPNFKERDGRVTAMDISEDGKKILLLTYRSILEIDMDLSGSIKPTDRWVKGQDYQEVGHRRMRQQEAIAFDFSGKGLLYTTESKKDSPIHQVTCR